MSRFLPSRLGTVEESRILDFEAPTESVAKSGGSSVWELRAQVVAVVLAWTEKKKGDLILAPMRA